MKFFTFSTAIITILASVAIAAPFEDRPVEANCGFVWSSACMYPFMLADFES